MPVNHTSFIRIKTSHALEPSIVLPVEVEVSENTVLFLSRELLDFGIIKSGGVCMYVYLYVHVCVHVCRISCREGGGVLGFSLLSPTPPPPPHPRKFEIDIFLILISS